MILIYRETEHIPYLILWRKTTLYIVDCFFILIWEFTVRISSLLVKANLTVQLLKKIGRNKIKPQDERSSNPCPYVDTLPPQSVSPTHRSVLHSAPYWKCIIDHPAHLKTNQHRLKRQKKKKWNYSKDCVSSHSVTFKNVRWCCIIGSMCTPAAPFLSQLSCTHPNKT